MSTAATQLAVDRPSGQRGDRGRDWRHLSQLFEKLPPHALEAEMSLLGSILLDPQVVGDVVLIVRSGEDFYKPANGAIYDTMVELYDKHASIDIVQLNQALADREILDSVGGLNYLVELADAVPSAANATHYARLVREKAMVRRLIEAAGDILYEAYHSPDQAQAILDQAEQRIFNIAQHSQHTQIESLHELIKQTISLLEASEGKQLTGLPTGFVELDELTGGLQRGEMIVIAARPSMGKTALALNIAEQMATHGLGVGIFSMEMSKQQVVQRILCARSGIDSQRLRRHMLRPDDIRALMAACDDLLHAPIFVEDTPGLSSMQLRAKARRMVAQHEIKIIIIDYLQLMALGGRIESRQLEVSEISRAVKAMARELNIPVVCLSQLNRSPEQREGHRPRMSDLRESGSIEQDADVVAMLHREDYYHQGDEAWFDANPDKAGLAELILAKQRNGPTGTLKLSWIADCTRFRDHSSAKPPSGYDDGGSSFYQQRSASIEPIPPRDAGADEPPF
ncbi:MAG: replicative DNA helicase [Planctomycetota bacterium]|jgi:replicative DNA helicase